MKKLLFIMLCGIVLSGCDEIFDTHSNRATKCNGNTTGLAQTLTGWMQDAVPDGYTIIVTDINDFYEYKTSPLLMGTNLYDEYKDSRICSATASVTIRNEKGKIYNGDAEVRFQYRASLEDKNGDFNSGVSMCGKDYEELSKKIDRMIYKGFEK